MKNILTFILFLTPFFLASQTDTTVYKIVTESPRFPGCEKLDTTLAVKKACAERGLLQFFNRNIRYPYAARQKNVQGSVIISMIVEPDGLISNPKILRDIGEGCGDEAIRVANGMNEALMESYLRWTPGKIDGKPVRAEITVPIRFRLEEPKDYVFAEGRDSMYVVVDDSVSFKGGVAVLEKVLKKNFDVPENYRDSCKAGIIDMTLYVHPSGYVRVIDLTDYWHLGSDYTWEAIQAATSTWGRWNAATRKGREVPASVSFTLPILPEGEQCKQVVADFEKANLLAEEGSLFFNEGKQEEGIAKLTEAISLFPENANFLYLRGQAYLGMEKSEEACEDFRRIRAIATIGLVENILPLLCGSTGSPSE